MAAPFHLVIYNFGIHVAPYGHSAIDGFLRREPLNFEASALAIGYVGRSGYEGEPGPQSWGVQTFPRFLKGSGQDSGPSSLSMWTDIESLMAFSYSGIHAEALKHARAWNVKQEWPSLVLFWVPAGTQPAWADAVERFEYLADNGATARAFNFKQAFTPQGDAYLVDRGRVKEIAALNAATQVDLAEALRSIPV